ncbi:MAG: oligosaccharide flippase family protein [Clostridiales bacterium]|nr:oligosaccharide flippase family protein [Clostridiales bacterium]
MRILKKAKDLLTNEIIYILADVIVKAIAFISLPFFLKIMTTSAYGEYSLYQTYVNVFTVFFCLNITTGVVRYYVDRENEKKHLTTAIWIILGFGIFSSLVLYIEEVLFGFMNISGKVVLAICVCIIFGSIFQLGLEDIRARMKTLQYAVFSLIYTILSTVLGLILVYNMKYELGYWRLVSITITTVLLGLIMSVKVIKRDGFTFNKETAKYLLVYSVPLIQYTFSSIVISQINRVFLANNGLSEVGIFSFASNLAMMMYIIAISINRAFQPFLFKALKHSDNYKKRMYQNMLLFYFIYVVFLFSIDILIWIFGNKEYSKASAVIPVLVLGYGILYLYSIISNFMYYYKKNHVLSIYSIISAGIIVILNAILIPLYGYIGAGIAICLAYFSLFMMGISYCKRKLQIVIFSSKMIIISIIALVIPVVIKLWIGGIL